MYSGNYLTGDLPSQRRMVIRAYPVIFANWTSDTPSALASRTASTSESRACLRRSSASRKSCNRSRTTSTTSSAMYPSIQGRTRYT